MLVNCRLCREHRLLVSAMSHSHDVDVGELGSALTPVSMGENVVAPDFAARLDLTTFRNTPVKQRVVARDSRSRGGRCDVLEECREATDHSTLIQRTGDTHEFREGDSCL